MSEVTRACAHCGGDLPIDPPKRRGHPRKYCQPLCARRAYAASRKADPERYKAMRAKSAPVQAEYQRVQRRMIACRVCGTLAEKRITKQAGKAVCSDLCRAYVTNGRWPQCVIPGKHPIHSTRVPDDHPARQRKCLRCLVPFTFARRSQTYCSRKCFDRANDSRRDARLRGAWVEDVAPAYIYARDQWRCHLCCKRIKRNEVVPHPLAPTIDHVIPLTQGGMHEAANLRAAHFICNARKSDGFTDKGEQLQLVG